MPRKTQTSPKPTPNSERQARWRERRAQALARLNDALRQVIKARTISEAHSVARQALEPPP